ncbi:MAG: hypothetical protein OXU54_06315, partial [Gammaproteobacteria bacterium]|nr:hypothetical protein [Gammaproteobacteria bacterium]
LIIIVPLVDDDAAELDETLNLRLVGTPTVAGSGGGTVALAAGPNDRSLDYTILGAEPNTASAAGTVAVSAGQAGVTSGSQNGRRIRFTFTLTDDDAAAGDTQAGADDTYRLWYTFYSTSEASNGFRLWTVLADSNPAADTDPAFFYLTGGSAAANRFRACDNRGRCLPGAGDFLTRPEGGFAPQGYGWVVIPQGETEAVLEVADNAFNDTTYTVRLFAVDNNTLSPGDTVLPDYDFTRLAQHRASTFGTADSSPAWLQARDASIDDANEGDTRTYNVRFRGLAPSGTLNAANPLRITWRFVGSTRHGDGDSSVRYPAAVGDIDVTGVTVTAAHVAHDGTAGSMGIGTITTDATRHIIAQQTLVVSSWPGDNSTDAFSVSFTVADDAFAEPAEALYFQVLTDRPEEVGEVPGDGFTINASDTATFTAEAIRGTDTDGDEADGSWREAAPSGNDNPLRFRLSISSGRPQEGALISWAVTQDADGANGDVSPSDFLQCINGYDSDDDVTAGRCARTQIYATLPQGAVRVSAALAAQATGPWTINLPFLLNDDGAMESAEDFTIDVNTSGNSGINAGTATDVDFTIAASSEDDARLTVSIGNADCAGAGSGCRASEVDTAGSIPAVNDRDAIRANQVGYPSRAQSDYFVGFPLSFHLPDGDDADLDPDPLAAGHNAVTGAVRIRYRIGGTIFDRATPGSGGAALSAYPRTGELRLSRTQVGISYLESERLHIRVRLPLASVTSATEPATFTVTLTEVAGNGGAVSLGAGVQGQVNVRRRGGLFFITAANVGAAVAANEVVEGAGTLTYQVRYYSGSGQSIPAGGVTLDWTLSHGVAARDTICNECPEPAVAAIGDTANADFSGDTSGDDAIVFTAGEASGALKTFTVAINDDSVSEGAESFSITIGGIRVNGTDADPSGSDWTLGRSVYTTTIAANDPHTFTLSCPSAVAESAGMLSCMVTHNGPALAEMTMLDWNIGTPNAAYTASVSDFSAVRAERNLGFPSALGGVQFAQSAADGAQVTFQVPIE